VSRHRIQVQHRSPASVEVAAPEVARLLDRLHVSGAYAVLRDADEAAYRDGVFNGIIDEARKRGVELTESELFCARTFWQRAWALAHTRGSIAERRTAADECVAREQCVAFSQGTV
jgi:hypothetical protein